MCRCIRIACVFVCACVWIYIASIHANSYIRTPASTWTYFSKQSPCELIRIVSTLAVVYIYYVYALPSNRDGSVSVFQLCSSTITLELFLLTYDREPDFPHEVTMPYKKSQTNLFSLKIAQVHDSLFGGSFWL